MDSCSYNMLVKQVCIKYVSFLVECTSLVDMFKAESEWFHISLIGHDTRSDISVVICLLVRCGKPRSSGTFSALPFGALVFSIMTSWFGIWVETSLNFNTPWYRWPERKQVEM